VFLSILQWAVFTHPPDPGQRVTQHAFKESVFSFLGYHLLDFDNKVHVGNYSKEKINKGNNRMS
jgi:hypothetical protein